MHLELADIAIFTLIAAVALIWWNVQTVRQRALAHAKRRCKELDLQFLDGSISINFSGLRRTPQGQMGMVRSCRFEFSATGEDRHQGEVLMLGNRLLSITLPPHPIPR